MKKPMSRKQKVNDADKRYRNIIKMLYKEYDIHSTQNFLSQFEYKYNRKNKLPMYSHIDIQERYIDFVNKFERYSRRYVL